jgi:hypothetical protein
VILQEKVDGAIDRSKARDTPSVPLTVTGRFGVGNTRCGNHLGQRLYVVAPKGRTYGSKRSDQKNLLSPCMREPSTYAETILASDYMWSHQKAVHMEASDPIKKICSALA